MNSHMRRTFDEAEILYELLLSATTDDSDPRIIEAGNTLSAAEQESFEATEWSVALHNKRLAEPRARFDAALREVYGA